MTALITTLLALWLAMGCAPATPVARWLRAWLVEAPARRLAAIRQASVVAVLLAVAIAGLAWAVDDELLRVAAMAAPDAAVWLSMVEVGTLVDVAAAALAARTVLRVGTVRTMLRAMLGARRTRRARRITGTRRPNPANDDEDPALAA